MLGMSVRLDWLPRIARETHLVNADSRTSGYRAASVRQPGVHGPDHGPTWQGVR